jgi:predicted acetyltransferase
LLEPRKLNITSSDGFMARIVDVERALLLRPYAGEGTLIFEVIDDLCPWNRGKWKLAASRAESSISRTGEGAQMVMPVSTLAMLMFGQISPSLAASMGRLDVNDAKALPLWNNVMETPCRPFCADFF